MSTSRESTAIDAPDLFIREMRPASIPRGAFLLLHGMESHSGWFLDCAARLVQNGYAVVAYDQPGWGKSPGPRGHLPDYRSFVETASGIAAAARKQYGPLHLAGMSWGGMAALYLCLRRPWLFSSLSLIAPGLAARRDFSLMDKLRLASAFAKKDRAAPVSPVFKPHHFTKSPEWQNVIQNDPDRVHAVTASFCVETLKMRRFIRETAGRRRIPPALCLLAGEDRIIDNSAVSTLCRKAGCCVEILPGCAHTLVFERPGQTAAILARHAEAASPPATSPAAGGGTVWIVGAGAVGGAAAALLSFGGVATGVLTKPAHLETLAKNSLTLRSGDAFRTARSGISFAADPERLPPDPDLVVLAVKSFDTASALAALAGRIPQSAVLASLQNGVDNEHALAHLFPKHTIVAASICASLEAGSPGSVTLADDRGGLGAALHQGDADQAQSVWTRIMPCTGMECRWYDGPDAGRRLKWSKLMLNIGFNALNSVTGLSSAQLLADRQRGELALSALREGFSAMRGLGLYPVDLPGFPVSTLRMFLKIPGSIPRKILSWRAGSAPEAAFSMRQDIVMNRQYTEIQELNGKILEVSQSLGIPAPANEKLIRMVAEFREKNMA